MVQPLGGQGHSGMRGRRGERIDTQLKKVNTRCGDAVMDVQWTTDGSNASVQLKPVAWSLLHRMLAAVDTPVCSRRGCGTARALASSIATGLQLQYSNFKH